MVHELVQNLADECATATGMPITSVPYLGPSVVVDQLRVMVYDYLAFSLNAEALALQLTELRRSLP